MHDIRELIERVKKKDMLAMKLLYQQAAQPMLSISMRITQDRVEAEDILQESFLTSFQQIQKLTEPTKYFSWLKRIVINNSLKAVKGKHRYEEIDNIEAPEENDIGPWYENVPFAKIKTAIDELPDGCREIFTLYLLEGYKHREIADLLQIAVSTSKSQYRYALKLMKDKLMAYKPV